jgi:hypothetical protein
VASNNTRSYTNEVKRLEQLAIRLGKELAAMEAQLQQERERHAVHEDYEAWKRAKKMRYRLRKEAEKNNAAMQLELAEEETELQVLHGDHVEPSYVDRAHQRMDQKSKALLAKLQAEEAETVEKRATKWVELLMEKNKAIAQKQWEVTEVTRRFNQVLEEHSAMIQPGDLGVGYVQGQNAYMHGANVPPPAPRVDSMDARVVAA